jgi:hypothetical protein
MFTSNIRGIKKMEDYEENIAMVENFSESNEKEGEVVQSLIFNSGDGGTLTTINSGDGGTLMSMGSTAEAECETEVSNGR